MRTTLRPMSMPDHHYMGERASRRFRETLLDGVAPATITLTDLCDQAARLLGAAGAAVQLSTDGQTAVTEASDPAASRVADLQATLGEGPTLDTLALHQPVLSADPSQDRRWPQLAAAVRQCGVGAAVAVPMLDDTNQLGALTIYLDGPGEIDGTTLAQITHLARVMTGIILSLPVDPDSGTGLARAISAAAGEQGRVHQAAEIISVDQPYGLEEALIRMRLRLRPRLAPQRDGLGGARAGAGLR